MREPAQEFNKPSSCSDGSCGSSGVADGSVNESGNTAYTSGSSMSNSAVLSTSESNKNTIQPNPQGIVQPVKDCSTGLCGSDTSSDNNLKGTLKCATLFIVFIL